MMQPVSSHIVLLRHGRTGYNLEGRFTGQLDVPLAPEGYQDASFAAQKLKHSHFIPNVIYVSPLQRTQQSARRICEDLGIPQDRIVVVPEIIERNSGALMGLTRPEAEARFGTETVHACDQNYFSRCPDRDSQHPAESMADVEQRVRQFINSRLIADMQAGNRVLVLGHENSLRALAKILGNLSPDQAMRQFISATQPIGYTANIAPEGTISVTPYADVIQPTIRTR